MVQFTEQGTIKIILIKRNEIEYDKKFYEAIRKRDVKNEVYTISKNTNFIELDVRKIYNHILVNENSLENRLRRFGPSYDTVESWGRLK